MAVLTLMTTWLAELERMLGRHFGLDREITRDEYMVVQRCAACAAEVRTPVGWEVAHASNMTEGHALLARRLVTSWLKHVCPPVTEHLLGMSWGELEALRDSLELESVRLAERAATISGLITEKSAS